jgi:hypothetical protein
VSRRIRRPAAPPGSTHGRLPSNAARTAEHEATVQAAIDEPRVQQARLREKLYRYRGELTAQSAETSSTRTDPSLRSVT